jgi:hypothetical protein
MENYLSAEQLIIDRLEAQIDGVHVLSAADLSGVDETRQVTPAVHVIYNGDDLGDRAGDGADQIVRQRWLTVVATRNVRNISDGKAAREDAGKIVLEVLDALAGWQPDGEHGNLVRIAGPSPAYRTGYLYIPLAWHTAVAP